MERFLELVLPGGLAMVAGLWLAAATPAAMPIHLLGWLVALTGAATTLAGVRIAIGTD